MLQYQYVNAEVLGEIFVPVTSSAKSLTCKCTGHELTSELRDERLVVWLP
jgi:hypothetical protein